MPVLSHVLLDWHIWHRAAPGVWEKLLYQLEHLLVSPGKGVVSCNSINWKAFMEAKAIAKLLMASKVCVCVCVCMSVCVYVCVCACVCVCV